MNEEEKRIHNYIIEIKEILQESILRLTEKNTRYVVALIAQRLLNLNQIIALFPTKNRHNKANINQDLEEILIQLTIVKNESKLFKNESGALVEKSDTMPQYLPQHKLLENFDRCVEKIFTILFIYLEDHLQQYNNLKDFKLDLSQDFLQRFDQQLQTVYPMYSEDDWRQTGHKAIDYTFILWTQLREAPTTSALDFTAQLNKTLLAIENISFNPQQLAKLIRFIDPDNNDVITIEQTNKFFLEIWALPARRRELFDFLQSNSSVAAEIEPQMAKKQIELTFTKISEEEADKNLKNEKIVITKEGLQRQNNSNTQEQYANRRVTLFGGSTKIIKNDICMTDSQVSPRHFQIVYKPISKFCLLCTSITNPTSVLINKDLQLFPDCVICFGEFYYIRVVDLSHYFEQEQQIAPAMPSNMIVETGTVKRTTTQNDQQNQQINSEQDEISREKSPALPDIKRYNSDSSLCGLCSGSSSEDENHGRVAAQQENVPAAASKEQTERENKMKLKSQQQVLPPTTQQGQVAVAAFIIPCIAESVEDLLNASQIYKAANSIRLKNGPYIKLQVFTKPSDNNENTFDYNKSILKREFYLERDQPLQEASRYIVRIGSDNSCELQVNDSKVKPIEMQIQFDFSAKNNCWMIANKSLSQLNNLLIKTYQQVVNHSPSMAYPLSDGDAININNQYHLQVAIKDL